MKPINFVDCSLISEPKQISPFKLLKNIILELKSFSVNLQTGSSFSLYIYFN